MPASPSLPWSNVAIDPSSADGLQDGIARQVRAMILGGLLRPGATVPSTRLLARDLGVARQTVVLAYERLAAEGYVEGRPGSRTQVSRVLPEHLLHTPAAPSPVAQPSVTATLSARGAVTAALPSTPVTPGTRLLAPGLPALDQFPYRLWERLSAEIMRGRPEALLGYADPGGYRPLREAIAAYLGPVRGIACAADQVIITSGSQQAIDLAAHLLADPGDAVWAEEPGYMAGRHALTAAGLLRVPVPVDEEGIDVAWGVAASPRARLALVTPSHQYPLGVVMSLRRRLALLDWARRAGAWIIEDDYDSEFRYAGRPLQPLAALGGGSVIYTGTFSKVLAPGLRLGYLVVPSALIGAFRAARALTDRHPPGPSQAVLAEFIAAGHLAAHVRRMRGLYQERRDALHAAVQRHAAGLLAMALPACGLHAVGYLCDGNRSDAQLSRRALQAGLQTPPLSAYYAGACPLPGLVMGFASTPADQIEAAVRMLSRPPSPSPVNGGR